MKNFNFLYHVFKNHQNDNNNHIKWWRKLWTSRFHGFNVDEKNFSLADHARVEFRFGFGIQAARNFNYWACKADRKFTTPCGAYQIMQQQVKQLKHGWGTWSFRYSSTIGMGRKLRRMIQLNANPKPDSPFRNFLAYYRNFWSSPKLL